MFIKIISDRNHNSTFYCLLEPLKAVKIKEEKNQPKMCMRIKKPKRRKVTIVIETSAFY